MPKSHPYYTGLSRRRSWPKPPPEALLWERKTTSKWCDCWKHCKGGRWVGKRTRARHLAPGDESEQDDSDGDEPVAHDAHEQQKVENGLDGHITPDDNEDEDMYEDALHDQARIIRNLMDGHYDNPEYVDENDNMDPPGRAASPNHAPSPTRTPSPSPPPEELPQTAEDMPVPTLENLMTAQKFIDLLREARLDDKYSKLSPEDIDLIRNPAREQLSLDDPGFRLSLDIFLAVTGRASQKTYSDIRDAIHRYNPTAEMLTYGILTRRIKAMTGVVPIMHDMCINSCLAYTGAFHDLMNCTYCGEARYKPLRTSPGEFDQGAPRRQFMTIPLAMQAQAVWRHPATAEDMSYAFKELQKVLEEKQRNGGLPDVFHDIVCGEDLLQAMREGKIKEHDLLLLFSMDGCRLYRNKQSDTWIAIWLFLNLHWNVRYLKKHIRPAFTIPGPNHPKHMDSFIFPSLHHLAALQNEPGRLQIWDARDEQQHSSDPYLVYGTSDTVALADMGGWVGHNGKCGCRFMCGLQGRHKFHAPTYYPVLLKPNNSEHIPGTNRPDVDINELPEASEQRYSQNLALVLSSRTATEYRANRLATGITKPSIFSGLPRHTPMPRLFPGDAMHRDALNLPQLFISLFRGTIAHSEADPPSQWPWAVLADDDVWQAHGKEVEKWGLKLSRFVAGSRPPRNPAEKMNSGYTAKEYMTWMFNLAPGLLYKHLPRVYWKNLCKISYGIDIIHSHTIPPDELLNVYQKLREAVLEYELIYYQRRLDRLHFVTQCVHGMTHMAPEVVNVGSPAAVAQWTLERIIGDLEAEIRQHSQAFANISKFRAVWWCLVGVAVWCCMVLCPPCGYHTSHAFMQPDTVPSAIHW
ncbi:hypothetical protein BDZ89DRAFT_1116600 [Hymenopellis radicata]|nr:hypothetical protein BDZ89DRAFT_1116600 [Hymenopellis radicata]